MALSPARPRAAHRALLRAALGLLLLACLPSPASAQRPAEDPAARQVREAVARGDLKGAIDLGRSLLPANLDNPRLREQLGGAYYLASVRLQRGGAAGETVAGLQREARTHLARAAELAPGPLPIRLIWTLALLENSLGDAAGALRAAERGLRDHPGELRLLTVRAQARTALGELDEAEREWRALVAAQPGSLDAVIGLGGCLEALGRACDAADLFIDSGFAEDEGEAARSWRAQFELVRVLVACGRLDDTIGPLERALALEPQRARIAVELAEQYHRAGRSDDALPLLDRWLGERGFVDRELRTTAHYRRARILANRGEMARAREDYEAVLAREPAHTGALRGLGALLLRSGEEGGRARGRALLERFRHHAPLSDEIRVARNNVRRAPDRPALRVALIELLLKVPDLDAARVELADFAARLPRSPELPRLRARIAVAELAPGPGKGER